MKDDNQYIFNCEVCGRREILTAEEGYERGWNYPPMTSDFGVVMPRKCGNCSITETAWWALCVENMPLRKLSIRHWITILRIVSEPESITVGVIEDA